MAQSGGMAFLFTTLIFLAIGAVGSLGIRITYNKGPAANRLHVTLVMTAAVCCWMMWAIVYLAQLNPLVSPILSSE